MNCALISKSIGYSCHSLTDDGDVAMIDTPFKFADGDDIPAYVELGSDFVRFFDDGDVFFHFLGRGIRVDDESGTLFLSEIAASNGVVFSEGGNVQIQTSPDAAAAAFDKYLAAILAFVNWEREWEAKVQEESTVSTAK